MLSDPGAFLDSLMNFDKESITETMIKNLKKYVLDPSYEPEKIKKVLKYYSFLPSLAKMQLGICKSHILMYEAFHFYQPIISTSECDFSKFVAAFLLMTFYHTVVGVIVGHKKL